MLRLCSAETSHSRYERGLPRRDGVIGEKAASWAITPRPYRICCCGPWRQGSSSRSARSWCRPEAFLLILRCLRLMRRYSTLWALSNLKNSLKSAGRWIVAIDNLTHQLHGLQTFIRALGKPVSSLVRRFQKRCGGKRRPVQFGRIHAVHHLIIQEHPRPRKHRSSPVCPTRAPPPPAQFVGFPLPHPQIRSIWLRRKYTIRPIQRGRNMAERRNRKIARDITRFVSWACGKKDTTSTDRGTSRQGIPCRQSARRSGTGLKIQSNVLRARICPAPLPDLVHRPAPPRIEEHEPDGGFPRTISSTSRGRQSP